MSNVLGVRVDAKTTRASTCLLLDLDHDIKSATTTKIWYTLIDELYGSRSLVLIELVDQLADSISKNTP